MLNKLKQFFKKLKRMRLDHNEAIVLYGLFEKKDPNFAGFKSVTPSPLDLMKNYTPITVAPTKKDAIQAIDKLIYFKHFEHFALWCQSHGYIETCAWTYPVWDQYKRDVIGRETLKEESAQYHVFALTYSRRDLASIIRMFSHVEPLLLPYEKEAELQSYLLHTPILADPFAQLIASDTVDGAKIKNAITQIQKIASAEAVEKNLEEN